jgi:hypothetical protein
MRNPVICSVPGCGWPAEEGVCFIHRPRDPIPDDALEVRVFVSRKKAQQLHFIAKNYGGSVDELVYAYLETMPPAWS